MTRSTACRSMDAGRSERRQRAAQDSSPRWSRSCIVERARRRLAAGFYDKPECLNAALDAMIAAAQKG